MNTACEKPQVSHPVCNYPWLPDHGDGVYFNPVICADYSDPDVIRLGDDFWMTASSFNCTPGLPILHSKDLVNWTLVAHAVKNLPHSSYAAVQSGCGIWAPAIRFHAGKFWIFFPTPDEGIYVVTAPHPVGPWSEPHLLKAGRGLIDPCPLWDDDGRAYVVHAYAYSRAGFRHKLRVCEMSPDGMRLANEGQLVFDAPDRQPTIEGPKFLKRAGWYYILAPAGGVQKGWQTVLRSKSIFGPYEDKIVLEQGSTPINGPHQGALVDTRGGDWWFIHFQDAGVYGRVTHLQPVRWVDDWPLMGRDHDGNGIGEPVSHFQKPTAAVQPALSAPQSSDEFDAAQLGLQWQWQANHENNWFSLDARKGWLRLFARNARIDDLSTAPNLLLQKFPARSFVIETTVELNANEAGVAIMGRTWASLALRCSPKGCELVHRSSDGTNFLCGVKQATATLRVEVAEGGMCSFSFRDGFSDWKKAFDFQATAGVWIGAKIGIYCLGGEETKDFADFDYFRFSPPTQSRP